MQQGRYNTSPTLPSTSTNHLQPSSSTATRVTTAGASALTELNEDGIAPAPRRRYEEVLPNGAPQPLDFLKEEMRRSYEENQRPIIEQARREGRLVYVDPNNPQRFEILDHVPTLEEIEELILEEAYSNHPLKNLPNKIYRLLKKIYNIFLAFMASLASRIHNIRTQS